MRAITPTYGPEAVDGWRSLGSWGRRPCQETSGSPCAASSSSETWEATLTLSVCRSVGKGWWGGCRKTKAVTPVQHKTVDEPVWYCHVLQWMYQFLLVQSETFANYFPVKLYIWLHGGVDKLQATTCSSPTLASRKPLVCSCVVAVR